MTWSPVINRHHLRGSCTGALILSLIGCVTEYPETPMCFPELPVPASLAQDPENPLYSDQCCKNSRNDCRAVFEGVVSAFAIKDVDCAPAMKSDTQVCVHRCAQVEGCSCLTDQDCCPDNDPSCLTLRCGSPKSFGITAEPLQRATCAEEVGVDDAYCLYCDRRGNR